MQESNYNRLRLGLNVRLRRHVMHLTQAQVALRMGCSPRTISAIERGKHNLSVEMLLRLCQALECSFQDLLIGV